MPHCRRSGFQIVADAAAVIFVLAAVAVFILTLISNDRNQFLVTVKLLFVSAPTYSIRIIAQICRPGTRLYECVCVCSYEWLCVWFCIRNELCVLIK